MRLFLSLVLGTFLAFSLAAQEKERDLSSRRILESLAPSLPGGDFVRLQVREGRKGSAISYYEGPYGVLFSLELSPRKDPPETLEKAHKEKLRYMETLKDPATGKKISGRWSEPGRKLTIPGLAGKSLSGIRMQAELGKKGETGKVDLFLMIYKERLLEISFFLPDKAFPPQVREKLFPQLLYLVGQILYEGEKVRVAPYRKKLFLEAFETLMRTPEKAAMQSHAILRFVEKSSAVIVRIDDADFPWKKELLKKPEGKRAFALLLSAYMGGNAAQQLRSGICADRRKEGMIAMKKMYILLRQKKILSLQIPELEK